MNNQSQNKVYESFDIISQEMARKIVEENRHKLTTKDNTEFYKTISPIEETEKKEVNDKERDKKKKWTMSSKIIFSKKKNQINKNKENINNENPLINVQVSTIKKEEEKKNDKDSSSFKNNLINNINNMFENKNNNEIKNNNPLMNKKDEKILILKSEETSNSLVENNENSSGTDNKKEKDASKENNNEIENDKNEKSEKNKKEFNIAQRRKSVQIYKRFSNKKNVNFNLNESYSKSDDESSKNDSKNEENNDVNNSSEKLDQKLNSSNLLLELSKEEKNEEIELNKRMNLKKKSKRNKTLRNEDISPLCSSNDMKIFSKKKTKNLIKLEKIYRRNMIIYKPKWTPKQFYQHEIFLQKRKERINISKKTKQIERENRNYKQIPTIDPLSIDIINKTESYIPLIRRSVEYGAQKMYKNILNERIKLKELKSNKMYFLDKTERDIIYWRQKLWKKKVEQKLNKSSYKLQKLKEKEEEIKKYRNYKLQLCPKSKSMINKNIKYFHTTNDYNNDIDNYNSKKRMNAFEKLYQDSQLHEKKIKEITKSYTINLFRPNIKQDFIIKKKNIKKNESYHYSNNIYHNKVKRKKLNNNNNIKRNKKSSISIIFEDISIQNNKSRNKKIKNETLTSIDSTKTSKNASHRINIELDNTKNVKSKIFQNTKKEVIPLKLGEIKEVDNAIIETSQRKNKKENDKIKKINDNTNNINFNSNSQKQNKSINSNENNNINLNNNQQLKLGFHKNIDEEYNKLSYKEQNSNLEKAYNLSNDINNVKFPRKTSYTLRPKSLHNFDKKKDLNILKFKEENEENKMKKINNDKDLKLKTSLIQEENDINKNNENNKSNSPSFNLLSKKEKENRIDNSSLNNNSINIIQESGSFGNYQFSNFISKEDISKENQEKEIKRQKTIKTKKTEKNKNFSNLKNLDEISKKNIKKVITFKFNPYENQKSKENDTFSSEETSSLKEEEDDLLQKIRNIEMKEERNKIDKIIEGKKIEKNKFMEKHKEKDLYMLNLRNNVANELQEPFIYTDNKGIFFQFFKKN